MKKVNWSKVVSVASWGIVVVLFYGVFLLISDPPTTGPIVAALGVQGVQVIFGLIYGGEAGTLAYAKFAKRKNLRRHALLVIYLMGFFTSILGFVVGGNVDRIVKNILLSLLAAGCWLYWTIETKYISPTYFQSEVLPMRNDLPPS